MKKKSRFLALIFSLLLVFLTGCGNGGPAGVPDYTPEGEEPADPDTPSTDEDPVNLLGVKVLSKPASYDFDAALGDYSVNYYNLFASNLLKYLYSVYEDPTTLLPEERSEIFKSITTMDSSTITYTTDNSFNENENRFYLFDSIRYTIESVDTTNKTDGTTTRTFTLRYNAWNWNIKPNARNKQIIFLNILPNENFNSNVDNKFTLEDDDLPNIYLATENIPSFKEFYVSDKAIQKGEDKDGFIYDYYPSPFKDYSAEDGAKMSNYFQDALEYAIYLFVLGYDYTITEDAPLFDFEIRYGSGDKLGHVTGIDVGGWGNEKISVEDALERVKDMYQADGGYVGLTEKNKTQVVNFILEKIIGADAIGNRDGEFEVARNTLTEVEGGNFTRTSETPLKFDRRYSEIVENIIDYACDEVTIGYNPNEQDEELSKIKIDTPYPTSIITDYRGDYFASAPSDEEGEEDMMRYISPAEYQSIVLYPKPEDLADGAFPLSYFSLMIEYWDNQHDTWEEYNASAVPEGEKRYLKEITITVGLRVFSKSQKKLIVGGPDNIVEVQKTIPFESLSKDIDFDEYDEFYDRHSIAFSDSDEGGVDVTFGENVMIETAFNQNIGDGAINPFAFGDYNESLFYKSFPVSGNNSARAYYKLNESRSYGFFGSLNEEMFGGDDGCDFIEIYFDIQKAKGVTGANYNFKVSVDAILKVDEV